MRSLSELYLDNMGLEKLSSLTFVRLKMLKVVDLRNNTLQSLSITRIPVFTKVYLAGNPWRCDCSLIRLQIQLLLIKSLDTEQQVLCQSPNALKGESLVKIHLLKLTCPAFGEDVSGTSPLTPSIRRLPHTSILSVAETLKTTMNYQSLPKTTFLTTTRNTIEANVQDPCLADQISNVLVSSAEKKSLDVSWSAHGDFNQFEIRYSTAEDMSTLRITVSLTKVRLYHLQPGTYRICIVPWSVEIFKCPAPKSRQCAEGQTEDTAPEHAHHVDFPPGSNSPLITAGVSVGLIVLIAVIIFIVYKIRSNKIQFQRYYNEDRAERSRKQETDPYTWDGVYENIDEDRHVYVTASSLWGMDNEKLDCSVTEQGSLPSVPKYVTL
ncbi:hypothetical protein GDO86_007437 [Hymenochirus boettgeri]|uniref:LRRCT domain-containing protein n=1 Tax=Hymenochirus boettgeri TaxID=247094 RepID=A0A8T2IYZ3_9PIPI|nr:hypothetical protein GDO86_007437 [Hymenochirus boettgeri]